MRSKMPGDVIANAAPDAKQVALCGRSRTVFTRSGRPAKVLPWILLWAIGVPIPLILLLLLIRGCFG